MMKGYDIDTKYYNGKNKLFYVPVWGAFKAAPAPNIVGNFFNVPGENTDLVTMFDPQQALDPNIIDGTDSNGNACDLNNSVVIASIITEWNERVAVLKQYSTQTGPMGGEGKGVLLSCTRFASYEVVSMNVDEISKFQRRHLNPEYIETRKIKRSVSSTSLSGKTQESEQKFYVPPFGSLASQYTAAFSSVSEITNTVKSLFTYMILPHIVIEPNTVPSVSQNRTYTLEGNIMDVVRTLGVYASTRERIQIYAGTMVAGTAGAKNDELSSIIAHLNDINGGGFLSSIVSQLAPLIPF